MLGTYKDLIDLIIKDFSPYDATKDTIYEMKEMKMGNTLIEEHVAKFKMLVTKSKLEKRIKQWSTSEKPSPSPSRKTS